MEKKYHLGLIVFLLSGLMFYSLPAHADAGLPMLAVLWPLYWVAFIPIVLVEWLVIRRYFQQIPNKKLIWSITTANIFSTIIGIPLTWGAWTFLLWTTFYTKYNIETISGILRDLLAVTIYAPWLIREIKWMLPAAGTILLIVFYYISCISETLIMRKMLQKQNLDPLLLKKAVWQGNFYSYILLFLCGAAYLAWAWTN